MRSLCFSAFFLLASSPLMVSCSSGGSGSNPTSSTGEVTLALTDAPSDELAMFEVDVSNIEFVRADTSTVSVLTRRTRVDFLELESLTELMIGTAVAAGRYESMNMTLDFTNANVVINGQTTPAAVLDQAGNVLTGTTTVNVAFVGNARPNIRVSRRHLFLLDLDIDQALSVDSGANQVTFVPALEARLDPAQLKPFVLRGNLTGVDQDRDEITIERRAFDDTPIGTFTLEVRSTTVFQVDGVVSVGPAILATLMSRVSAEPVIYAQGTIDQQRDDYVAVAIETGDGTRRNGQDWVTGHIVARDLGAGADATLTVLGRSLDDSSGSRTFNTLHTVQVSRTATKVLRRGMGNTLTTDALNIGQNITAFGTIAGTALDATSSSSVVRMHQTSIWGTATGTPSADTLTLNVVRFGGRTVGSFDFSVNGNVQSDPANYTVRVTGLSTGGVVTGSKIRVIGWVNPVDIGGDQDSEAASLVDRTSSGRLLLLTWSPASQTAITASTSTELTLDVSGAVINAVADGFGAVPMTTSPAPEIRPVNGIGVFRIIENGALELHFSFSAFENALETRMQSSGVRRISALGTFESVNQVFIALTMTVELD